MIDPRRSFCSPALRLALLCASMTLTASAFAQSAPATSVPDYAGAIGSTPLVERDARTGTIRAKTAVEIDQAARQADPRRGDRERRSAEQFNRNVDAMPATAADARRQAKRSPHGGEIVLTSREELLPLYGIRDRKGTLRITHSPASAQASDNAK